jgi:peptidoglycan/xylan/chitin deacetylase (PgdA/CDA1 family)
MPTCPAARRGHGFAQALALAALLGAVPASPLAAAPPADDGAVVIMYHRFGEPDYPSTSVRIEQFEAHIAELASGRYSVLPVPEIMAALAEGRALPERAVGITIDDAFASVYREAWPRLRAAGLPFTLFAATRPLDLGLPGYMTWNQLRELVAGGGVTVGHHGVTHGHMTQQAESDVRAEIAQARARFQQELGKSPTLFAYPYGEYGLALRNLVAGSNFQAAFGQHSGAIARNGDRFALPRFPFSENYAGMDRFRLVVNSLPLPVTDITPTDPLITARNNPPPFGFTVGNGVTGLGALNCFASRNEASLERLGERRVEVRMAGPFPSGRARINCTMPGPEGRWRWFGMQFYVRP